jgi:hypothetical protein
MKFKVLFALGIASSVLASNAFAVECVSKDGVKLTWEKRARGLTTEGADHIATVEWKSGSGFYDAECVPLPYGIHEYTKYECYIEPEWNFFELVAVVKVYNDESIELLQTKDDRRFRAGYRVLNTYPMDCQ